MPRRRRRTRRSRGPRGSSARVRVTRTKGSSETKNNLTGGISITGMSPTGRIASSRPAIQATVRGEGTSLSRRDIRLYLNGSEKSRFHYDEASGQLRYYVGNALPPGTHEVKIEAEARSSGDQTQFSGTSRKRWTFTVVRR